MWENLESNGSQENEADTNEVTGEPDLQHCETGGLLVRSASLVHRVSGFLHSIHCYNCLESI